MSEEKYTFKAAAAAVNVSEQSRRAWHAKFVPPPEPCGENATVEELRDEVARLRKQLKRAELEREILKKSHGVLREGVAVKYAWITQHGDLYPIVLMCELLAVSKAGYYDSLRRKPSARAQRRERIHAAVRAVHAESQAIYGSFKIAREMARRDNLESAAEEANSQGLGVSSNGLMHRRAEAKNDVWTWDFVFDRTIAGSPLKWLSIVDEYTRECLALKVDRNIRSEDVIDALAELLAMRGVPRCIRSDNDPEFIAQALRKWLGQVGVETLYVEPGSPWENGYVESFHSRLRDEFLALEQFESLAAARKLTAKWKDDYNYYRPHGSLRYVAPAVFADRCTASATESP